MILVSSEEIKASLKAAAEKKAATNEPATAAETASAQVAPPAEKATPPVVARRRQPRIQISGELPDAQRIDEIVLE